MGLLLSGPPAGAGKSRRARQLLAQAALPTILVDFQLLYAAMLGIERDEETGRFPERDERLGYILPLVELQRQRLIRQAVEDDIEVVATNSDGDGGRRRYLLGLLGPGATEEVIDPGIQVVTERLSVNGQLSQQCGSAIQRWFSRLG